MEDSWIFIDDDNSSVHSLADSDKIDSETEAELYSKIHYEDNLSLKEKLSELIVYSPLNTDIFCVDKKKNASTPMKLTNEDPLCTQRPCDAFSTQKRKSSEIDTNCEKLTSLKKHKTTHARDLPSVILDSSHSKNTVSNSFFKNKSDKKDDTLFLDSSDSDSICWIDPSTENSDFRINLLKETETVFLSSSDSDNEQEVKYPILERNSILKNLSMPNMNIEENSKDLWHINYEDLRRSRKHSYRYHENDSVTCSNCNRKGHVSRACPSPRVVKCFVCGGNHLGYKCAKRMCSNCYTRGHDRKNCYKRMKRKICFLCNIEGHTKGNCPDLWRRYHLTTKPSVLKAGKPFKQDTNLYCWNCGASGHFGGVCPIRHHSSSSFNTWPCVVSYDNPKYLLKDRLSFIKYAPSLNVTIQDKHLNSISGPSEEKNVDCKVKNEMNVSSGSNEENKGNESKKKKLGTALRFNKVQDIIKQEDFPRTPKNGPIKQTRKIITFKDLDESPNPGKVFKFKNMDETLKTIIKTQLNKLKKQWNSQGQRASLQDSEYRELVNQIKTEESLPESIIVQVEKRFKRWKRNRQKHLRGKAKKRERKELTQY